MPQLAGAAPAAAGDLHTFLAQYERDFPDEVIHIEQPTLRVGYEVEVPAGLTFHDLLAEFSATHKPALEEVATR